MLFLLIISKLLFIEIFFVHVSKFSNDYHISSKEKKTSLSLFGKERNNDTPHTPIHTRAISFNMPNVLLFSRFLRSNFYLDEY